MSIPYLLFQELLGHVLQAGQAWKDFFLLDILIVQGEYCFQLLRIPHPDFVHRL